MGEIHGCGFVGEDVEVQLGLSFGCFYVVWGNRNFKLIGFASLDLHLLTPLQTTRRMDQSQGPTARRYVVPCKTTIPGRCLEPWVIEGEKPCTHAAMINAAQSKWLLDAASRLDVMYVFAVLRHVDVKRLRSIRSHHVVYGFVIVGETDVVPDTDSDGLGNELEINLVDCDGLGLAIGVGCRQSGAFKRHDRFRQEAGLGVFHIVSGESPRLVRIRSIPNESFDAASGRCGLRQGRRTRCDPG